MASATDAPVDLYIAAYDDPNAARGDWDTIKDLAKEDLIKVDGLILVSRTDDGKIKVDDDFHETRKGAALGAVGGAVIGLIFPPAILASAAVGAGIGAGAGALVSHGRKEEIKADVDDTLPLNSSGIVATSSASPSISRQRTAASGRPSARFDPGCRSRVELLERVFDVVAERKCELRSALDDSCGSSHRS